MNNPTTPETHTNTAGQEASTIELRDSPDLIKPLGHYSHLAIHAGLAYISGQLPLDAEGTPLTTEPFETQTRQVLHNLDRCLAAAGTDRTRLLSVTVYITDLAQWPAFDTLYAEWIGAHRPARAVAGVKDLHYGAAVEVQAIAALA